MNPKIISLLLLTLPAWLPAKTIEKEFAVDPGHTLFVDLKTGGSIEINGWDRNLARVKVRYSDRGEDHCQIEIEKRSEHLVITTYTKNRWNSPDCNLELTVTIPAGFDLDVSTEGGAVSVTGISGDLHAKTKGGGLELSGLSGTLHMTTLGGRIGLADSDVDGLVKTMGGNITFRNVTGNVAGKTMGGNVTYTNVTGRKDGTVAASTMGGNLDIDSRLAQVTAKTMGGNMTLRGEQIKASTMGGSIQVLEAPAGAEVSTMGGNIHVQSAGKFLKASTMGGNIRAAAVDGWIQTSTKGGDVTAVMIGDPGKGDRHVEISSLGGDLYLTLPQELSMTFDIELAYTRNSHQDYTIYSDFPLTVTRTEEWKGTFLSGSPRKYIYGTGKVGTGQHLIRLKTINGDITIRKGS